MNTLYVLLAFLAFTLFGYLSLVRIMYKFQFGKARPSLTVWRAAISSGNFARRLPLSALFISLPAVSLLLFWGWAPALLWLVIGHLLIETVFSFLISTPQFPAPAEALFLDFSDARGSIRAVVSQLTLMLMVSIVVVLLANMIDQQTGLLFALTGVFMSIHLLRSATGAFDAVIKLLASIGLLFLGLTLAHQMGISVFGNWAPLPSHLPWLKFDNRTLLAALLLVAAVQLTVSTALYKGVLNVVAGTVVGLLLILLTALIWQQPLLDAPILSTDERSLSLPSFISVFLLVSATSIAMLSQFVSNESPSGTAREPEKSFLQQQSVNIFLLVFSLVVCLWLASASGIGAWNTHYTVWPDGVTLQKHFALIIRSTAFASNAQTGAASVPFTFLIIAFCLFGVAALLGLLKLIRMKSLHASSAKIQSNNLAATMLTKTGMQYGLIFVGCCWLLSNGIPIYFWILTMSLCWLMVTDLLLSSFAKLESGDLKALLTRVFVLAFFVIGLLQVFWIGLVHALTGNMVYALTHLLVLLLAGLLMLRNVIECMKALKKRQENTLF